jgi:hypothetical protein
MSNPSPIARSAIRHDLFQTVHDDLDRQATHRCLLCLISRINDHLRAVLKLFQKCHSEAHSAEESHAQMEKRDGALHVGFCSLLLAQNDSSMILRRTLKH